MAAETTPERAGEGIIILGGVAGRIGCVFVGVIGLVTVVVLASALFYLWWIVPLGVVLLIAFTIGCRVRSRRGTSEGDIDDRVAQVRWPMDQWGDWR